MLRGLPQGRYIDVREKKGMQSCIQKVQELLICKLCAAATLLQLLYTGFMYNTTTAAVADQLG
jgi:hypothetical protein